MTSTARGSGRLRQIENAKTRARRHYKSRQFQKVYVAGARAALDGQSFEACPYPADGAGTWRRTWRRAWQRGHASVTSR